MEEKIFNEIVETQFKICHKMLLQKSREYCLEDNFDRLGAFKLHWLKVDEKLNCKQVLWGQLVKHLNSIHDMCNYLPVEADGIKLEVWNEKITDAINYLLILKGLVIENATNK